MGAIANTVSGFVALPVQFKTSKSFPEPVTHYIYLRRDEPKLPTPEAARSLFVVNIPITTTELHLKHLFATQLSAGRVERVEFAHGVSSTSRPAAAPPPPPPPTGAKNSKKRKRIASTDLQVQLDNHPLPSTWNRDVYASGAHAVVVFIDKPSRELSLRAAKKAAKLANRNENTTTTNIIWGSGIQDRLPPLGLKRYESHHALQYPSRRELLSSVDSYMTVYKRIEEAQAQEKARKRQEPDEEGFVTVTRGMGASRTRKREDGQQQQQQQLMEQDKTAKRKKSKAGNMENFYRFQTREQRKEQQGELMRRFEDDKKRVEEMRERRRGGVIVSR